MEVRKLTIAVPTFNRSDMTIESFYDVYEDPRVGEIIIVDDASDLDIYEDLKSMCDALPKVKLYRNILNQDCFRNKMNSIAYANGKWCILLDSDNKIDKSYIDKLFEIPEWEDDTIYTPSFARPQFDFRQYSGLTLTKENISQYIDKEMLEVCLNAANYFLPRENWLHWWDGTGTDPVTSDSIFVCYKWLQTGNKIKIVEGLEYEHRVHSGSHYQNNLSRTTAGFHADILNKLKQLT